MEKDRRKKLKTQGRTNEGIPESLVPDLLVTLPVKSLVRFRCVSKSWRTLINSHDFAKENHKHITNRTSNDGHRLILSSNRAIQSIGYDSSRGDGVEGKADMFYFPIKNVRALEIVGSCNGLLCLVMIKNSASSVVSLVVWNPCIPTEFKVAHSPERSYNTLNHFYGFGYDKYSDDYKIVRVRAIYSNLSFRIEHSVAIYSLKTNTWRKTTDLPMEVIRVTDNYHRSQFLASDASDVGTLADGVLYWVAGGRKHLIGFDLRDEEFKVVALPQPEWKVTQLGVCEEGCLLATRKHKLGEDDGPVELWKLHPKVDDENQLEWTKLMIFSSWEGIGSPRPTSIVPLYFHNNGLVLVGRPPSDYYDNYMCGNKPDCNFWLYNPKTDTLKAQVCELGGKYWPAYFQLMTHVDSLVSPNFRQICID